MLFLLCFSTLLPRAYLRMHEKELSIIRFSLLALFSSLMVIYLFLYEVKGDEFKTVGETNYAQTSLETKIDETQDYSTGQEDLSFSGDESDFAFTQVNTGSTTSTKSSPGEIKTLSGSTNPGSKSTNKYTSITILSGTKLFYGKVEVIEKLGIQYEYQLKDAKNIYYVSLGTGKIDLESTVRSRGGYLYTMKTEQEISKNKLFGQKVQFINLPSLKDTMVVLVITLPKATWLVQVPKKTYYGSKAYLKTLFID